jgi:HEAT repeat protein
VRARAASALARIGDPQTLPLLIELLRDKERIPRMAAAYAVVKFNDPRWLAPLSDMLLEDPEIEVRTAAADAMAQSHNQAVIPCMVEALQDSFWWHERDESAVAPLIEAVASFGPEAVPALVEALRHPEGAARQNAVNVLAMIGDPRSVEPLSVALYDVHFEVGQAAGLALARFGPASFDILEEATRASDTGIRLHAINALGLVKDPRALSLLASLLRDPDRQIVKQSVRSLVVTRDPRAAQILQPYAADRADRELSMLAREALTTLERTIRS